MLQAGIERAPLPPLRTELPSPAPGLTAPSDRVQVQTAEAPGQRDHTRDPYLDNAKYLTVVLVAIGHAWAPLTSDSRVASALYYLLYTFHMPAFIVVSGYLSRGFDGRHRQVRRLVTSVLVPYLVFQTLYVLWIRRTGADPDRELRYQEPGFALWFLVALFLWRLTAPLWNVLRYPLSVAVAVGVAASVTPSIDADLSLM
ncbi:MAG TPA: acyltransferase family protein, partial [Streptomyces sp.]|nr:acyltransferase family protein [Streptomyces sp.]